MLAGEQKVIATMMMITVIILLILGRLRVLLGERGAHQRATSATLAQSRPGKILTGLKMNGSDRAAMQDKPKDFVAHPTKSKNSISKQEHRPQVSYHSHQVKHLHNRLKAYSLGKHWRGSVKNISTLTLIFFSPVLLPAVAPKTRRPARAFPATQVQPTSRLSHKHNQHYHGNPMRALSQSLML